MWIADLFGPRGARKSKSPPGELKRDPLISPENVVSMRKDSIEWGDTPETSNDEFDKETSDATTPGHNSSRKLSESISKSFKSNHHIEKYASKRQEKQEEDVKMFNRLEEALEDLYDRLSEKLRSLSHGSITIMQDTNAITTSTDNIDVDTSVSGGGTLPEPGGAPMIHAYMEDQEDESDSCSSRLAWIGREDFYEFFPRLDFDATIPISGYE